MQITIPIWLYLLALAPWLQPIDGGLMVKMQAANAPPTRIVAEPARDGGWYLVQFAKDHVDLIGEIETKGRGKAVVKLGPLAARRRSKALDLSQWMKTPLSKKLKGANQLQLRDGTTLHIARKGATLTITDGKGSKIVLQPTGPPRAAGSGKADGIAMLKPPVLARKGKAMPRLGAGDSPEQAAATMFARLMTGDKGWQRHLSPTILPANRKLLISGLQTLSSKLAHVQFNARCFSHVLAFTTGPQPRGFGEMLMVLFGPYDVLLFANGNDGQKVHVTCRRHLDRWHVTGVTARGMGKALKEMKIRASRHQYSTTPPPVLGKPSAKGWQRLTKPIVIRAAKGGQWVASAGDPLAVAGSFLRAVMTRSEQLAVCMHPTFRDARMLARISGQPITSARLLAQRNCTADVRKKADRFIGSAQPTPAGQLVGVLASVVESGEKRLIEIFVKKGSQKVWRVVNRRDYRGSYADTQPAAGGKPHPALAVMNGVLQAVAKQDAKAIMGLLNAVNRRKVKARNVTGLLEYLLKKTAGKTTVSEIRAAPSHLKAGGVVGKVRVAGHEVFVVSLTFEGGHYRFEDINSPSIEMYNKLRLLWRR